MLVVAMAPGLTREFISGPPRLLRDSIDDDRVEGLPGGVDADRLSIASGPCSSITLAMVKTLRSTGSRPRS